MIIKDYFKKTDLFLWIFTAAATVYGCCLIASQQRAGEVSFLRTQIIAVFLGYAAAVLLSLVDYNYIARLSWFIGGFALLLTISVFFIGMQVRGTDDVGWIRLPGGMTFQPSELTKICFIVTFSAHISWLSERKRLKSLSGVASLILHAALPVGLIHLQGDDGAALVFAVMFVMMCFVSGVQLRYFFVLLVSAVSAVPLIWTGVMNNDQKNRLLVLFGSDDEAFRSYGWQQYQGKISIASGGVFGKGYYKGSRVAEGIVPYQENDFIFSVAGEELGFVGCAIILFIFLLILIRLLILSYRAWDPLGKSICIGFFALVGIQVLVNLGMVLGLLPVVGITLPFFSSGGTSVACLYLGVGLVQSVSMHPTDPVCKPVRVEISKTIRGRIFPHDI